MMTPNEIDQLADRIVERLSNRLPGDDCLIDKHGAAQLLGCSVASVERFVRNDKIPSVKIGGLRRFSKSDLLKIQNIKGEK